MDYDEFVENVDFLAVSRAYRILKLFLEAKDVSPVLRGKFESWLLDSQDRIEVDIALRMVFDESTHASFMDARKLNGELRLEKETIKN